MDLERSILLCKLELRPLDPFSWCGECECGEGGLVEGEPDPLGRRIGTLRLEERCFDDSVGTVNSTTCLIAIKLCTQIILVIFAMYLEVMYTCLHTLYMYMCAHIHAHMYGISMRLLDSSRIQVPGYPVDMSHMG